MAKNSKPTHVVLKDVRISYPHLFEPYAPEADQPEKYSAAFMFPKSDEATYNRLIKGYEAAIEQGKKGKQGQAFAAAVGKKKFWNPIQDGDEKDDATYHGHWYINAKNDRKPQVVDRRRNPIQNEEEAEDLIYAGSYVNASVDLYPFGRNGNFGVGIALGNVQQYRDGERLDGRSTAEEDFEVYDDDEDDDIFG